MEHNVTTDQFVYIHNDMFVVVSTFPSGRRLLECVSANRSHHKKGDPIVWYSEAEAKKNKR